MLLKVLGYEAGKDYNARRGYASDKEVNALQGKSTSELSNRQLAETTAQALQADLINGGKPWSRLDEA